MPELDMLTLCQEKSDALRREINAVREMTHWIAKVQNEARALAKENVEERLNRLNHIKEAQDKMESTFLDKKYYELQHGSLERDLKELNKWKLLQEGKASWSNLIAVGSLIAAVAAVVLHLVWGR